MFTFENGKFVYTTTIGEDLVTVSLDLNHAELRNMIGKARRAKRRRSVAASGALVVVAGVGSGR